MRGKPQAQQDFLTVVNLNACVPPEHPLRAIKLRLDAVLKKLSPLFDELCAGVARLFYAEVYEPSRQEGWTSDGHFTADFTLHNPITASEPMMAVQQIDAHAKPHPGVKVKTVGADKGCHQNGFITACRQRGIAPHVACKKGVNLAKGSYAKYSSVVSPRLELCGRRR